MHLGFQVGNRLHGYYGGRIVVVWERDAELLNFVDKDWNSLELSFLLNLQNQCPVLKALAVAQGRGEFMKACIRKR